MFAGVCNEIAHAEATGTFVAIAESCLKREQWDFRNTGESKQSMTFLTLAACEPASVQLISRNNGRIPPCRGVRLARHRRTHRPIQMHAKLNYSPVYRIEFFSCDCSRSVP
jgi:hypothetical protein